MNSIEALPSSNVLWQFCISDSLSWVLAQTLKLFVHSSSNRRVSQEPQCLKKVWDESQKADNQAREPLFHSLWLIHFGCGFMHDTLQCALLLSFIAGLESRI